MLTCIKNNAYPVRIMILALFCLSLFCSYAFAVDTCIDCHQDDKFRVQNKRLFDYYNDWKDSVHNLAGVSCSDCHGGNPLKSDKIAAHKDNFSSLSHMDSTVYRKIPDMCGKCHESELSNFRQSKHYKSLFDKGTGPHCVTCHGSMNVEVYYTSVIVRTCQSCHNEYTENMPEVAGEADKVLHRINVSRAFKNWSSLHYSEKEPEKVREINDLYQDVAESWHTFNFEQLDEKSMNLLNMSKTLVNRGLAEKRESRENK